MSQSVDMTNCTCSAESCNCNDGYLDCINAALTGASAFMSVAVLGQRRQPVIGRNMLFIGVAGGIIGWLVCATI